MREKESVAKMLKGYFSEMDNKEKAFFRVILVIVFVFSLAYLLLIYKNTSQDYLTKWVAMVLALISAVTFWLNFYRSQRLNESSFIMNINNQFIGNKDMSHIEHVLELYYNQYRAIKGDSKEPMDPNVAEKISLDLNLSRSSEDCQKLINYLVYLEALAALIDQRIIHLSVVDDLLSYRFFLAVNNPVVQDWELIPYSSYYNGIFNLAELWTKQHKEKNIDIPMEEFPLTMDKKDAKNHKPITKVEVSEARSKDNKQEIAGCIYDADDYIYPEAFGDNREKAVNAIAKLIGMNGTIFDYQNIIVARYNGQVCGVCIVYDPEKYDDHEKRFDMDLIRTRLGPDFSDNGPLKEGFDDVEGRYFKTIGTDKNKKGKKGKTEKTVELVVCCVDEGFRRHDVASTMLDTIIEELYADKNIILTVLADNEPAIKLYKNKGFDYKDTEKIKGKDVPIKEKGFAAKGLKEPEVYKMIRYADKRR